MNKKAIKEMSRNYTDTAVLKESGLQDPLCRKRRKCVYRYDLGEWVCQMSEEKGNRRDMQKLYISSIAV